MHYTYLLGLFLLLGIDGGASIEENSSKDVAHRIPATGELNLLPISIDNAMNSQQSPELEKTLNILYKRFFGSPPMKFSLRNNNDGQTSLSNTISMIGDKICDYITNLLIKFSALPLPRVDSRSSKLRETRSLKFSTFYQLFKMPLEVLPILQGMHDKVRGYMENNNYVELGYRVAKFPFDGNASNLKEEWMPLAISSKARIYSDNLYPCLVKNDTNPFDLKKSVGKLTSSAPEVVRRILHERLDKPVRKHPRLRESDYTELHAFVCHAIGEGSRMEYFYCLAEVKRVEECILTTNENTSSHDDHNFATKSSRNFVKSVKVLDNSCATVTGGTGFSIQCNQNRISKKTNDSLDRIDFFTDKSEESLILNRMANQLVSTVSANRTSVDAATEMATLLTIYNNGIKQRTRILKNAKDRRSEREGKALSKSLKDYKEHLGRMSLKTLNNVNQVITNVEKTLVDTSLRVSRQDLSDNVKTLKCFSDLIKLLFGDSLKEHPSSEHKNRSDSIASRDDGSASMDLISMSNKDAIQVKSEFVSANKTHAIRPKIIGGHDVKIRDVPFLFSIHSKTLGFRCGGTILSKWWGLSARHCLIQGENLKDLYVRAGSTFNRDGGSIHRIKKKYLYDSTPDAGIPYHDIMLLRFENPIRFSANAKPAKLPRDSDTPNVLRVAGWGQTNVSDESEMPASIKAVNLKKLSMKDCVTEVPWYKSFVREDKNLCFTEKEKDSCQGDSGGPLADSRTIYGIVSFGQGCASSPGVYAKVAFYMPWIKKITKL